MTRMNDAHGAGDHAFAGLGVRLGVRHAVEGRA